MKNKNKLDIFNNPDSFDKKMFEYYENKKENIPFSTQHVIENAFSKKEKVKQPINNLVKRIAIFIIAFGVMTMGAVYAKNIIGFITGIFNNTNHGIEKAAENGYIQNIEMDYIESNNIEVKTDYLTMDDKSLAISFIYKYRGEELDIKSIKANKMKLMDDKNNIICYISDEPIINTDIIGTNIDSTSEPVLIDKYCVRDSLLVTAKQFPASQILYVDISQVQITLNDNKTLYIDGNWNYSINIENKLVTRTSYEYKVSNDIFVDKAEITLNQTSLSIALKLNTTFDERRLYSHNAITLKDENNVMYIPTEMLSKNNSENSTINLCYPISCYDNINILYLHILLSDNKEVNLKLEK